MEEDREHKFPVLSDSDCRDFPFTVSYLKHLGCLHDCKNRAAGGEYKKKRKMDSKLATGRMEVQGERIYLKTIRIFYAFRV